MTLAQKRMRNGEPATALSRRRAAGAQIKGVLRVAWLSLLSGSCMLLASSCIVADPPEYQEPVQTRPVLDVYQAAPTTSKVLVVYTNDQVPISVPVRSEDAGEDLTAHFFIDYLAVTPNVSFNTQTIPASTYSDDSRVISLKWTVNVGPPTCHLLSLVVAHRSSFRLDNQDVLLPDKAATDVAIINWWLNVNPSPDATSTLVGCPTNGISTTTGAQTK